ncbi:MAG: exodeoxyribonuclease V subunit alpha [Thermodesulfobacteriota bacterium]|nr:exodeoxyribonuclease V subunit alpha [Thermodesulfobacteriota bacterium]
MLILKELKKNNILSSLDVHFARLMGRLAQNDTPEFLFGAALASNCLDQGHVCVDIPDMAGRLLDFESADGSRLRCPPEDRWIEILKQTSVVGGPDDFRPLILDEKGRLYLYRYWEYERQLATAILSRAGSDHFKVDSGRLREDLDSFFPEYGGTGPDRQRVAAVVAVINRFSVISGGPGTGKTHTAVRIMALLLGQALGGSYPESFKIALAAPTGKAAARLQESVRRVKASLQCSSAVRDAIPDEAFTIHRLLGFRHGSPYFRYGYENPLPYDAVIVDEASMVDLALMAKLVQAVPETSRLVLLGDMDQLASVEAGAVLGDICNAGAERGFSKKFRTVIQELTGDSVPEEGERAPGLLRDCITVLQESRRFGSESEINALAQAVNHGDEDLAVQVLRGRQGGLKPDTSRSVYWHEFPLTGDLKEALKDRVVNGYKDYIRAIVPEEAITAFERFRILCVHRHGPFGVVDLNGMVEEILSDRNLIPRGRRWYPYRPVMVTRNDYTLKLFNGDVGIALPDPDTGGDLRVFFISSDGIKRSFPPGRLPEHETVFAMTVHKSQGSEFDNVLFVLPLKQSQILTRELIYTGITRAGNEVELWAEEGVFRAAVKNRIQRNSGLRDLLW